MVYLVDLLFGLDHVSISMTFFCFNDALCSLVTGKVCI